MTLEEIKALGDKLRGMPDAEFFQSCGKLLAEIKARTADMDAASAQMKADLRDSVHESVRRLGITCLWITAITLAGCHYYGWAGTLLGVSCVAVVWDFRASKLARQEREKPVVDSRELVQDGDIRWSEFPVYNAEPVKIPTRWNAEVTEWICTEEAHQLIAAAKEAQLDKEVGTARAKLFKAADDARARVSGYTPEKQEELYQRGMKMFEARVELQKEALSAEDYAELIRLREKAKASGWSGLHGDELNRYAELISKASAGMDRLEKADV